MKNVQLTNDANRKIGLPLDTYHKALELAQHFGYWPCYPALQRTLYADEAGDLLRALQQVEHAVIHQKSIPLPRLIKHLHATYSIHHLPELARNAALLEGITTSLHLHQHFEPPHRHPELKKLIGFLHYCKRREVGYTCRVQPG